MLRYFISMSLILMSVLSGAVTETMAEGKSTEIREEIMPKSVAGTVTGVSANFIAVEYGADKPGPALEMAFNVDKDVVIENKKSLKDIGVGDTVEVAYDEIRKMNREGKKIGTRNVAKKVRFIKAAPKMVETSVLSSSPE
ncbi:MAG: hypothetical protein A2Z72_06810 [Omnitrophica bacterium RBG_13_46_9]|nr:MAG: hypothetical protein A2Z72_06810 [Omnitrophica bacterium RBG_13_46_9]